MMVILRVDTLCMLFVCVALGTMHTEAWFFRRTKSVCYGSLGCFDCSSPFDNTKGVLPESPGRVGVDFWLYTRDRNTPRKLLIDPEGRLTGADNCFLNASRPTRLIIHGFIDRADKPWVVQLVTQLLHKEEQNIIAVDWREGARNINYLQAVANTRVVAAIISQFLTSKAQTCNLDMSNVHLIGHSLGAHIAGYVGKNTSGIDRITGLDPAGPAFKVVSSAARLDASDADFVDVIHTSAETLHKLGFGLKKAIGTVDYYPNGGKDQPGCPRNFREQFAALITSISDLKSNVVCSHHRAIDLFKASINTGCVFTSFPCAQRDLQSGCNDCGSRGCTTMGYDAGAENQPAGIYYLNTTSTYPFCDE